MIYLDHAATTPLDEKVLNDMLPYLSYTYGNASSQHAFGRQAANAVTAARDNVAKILGVQAKEIYFTGSATEADNTAIKGICRANSAKGKHIVVSAIEHPAIIESAKDLTKEGFEVTYVNPDCNGVVTAEAVNAVIRQDTVFVGVMSANNETGVIQPIAAIYDVCKAKSIFFFCDCVQSCGVLTFGSLPADGYSLSAHKFYGPKGVGVLCIKSGNRFERLIAGGHQERGLRGGTTNTAAIIGLSSALTAVYAGANENTKKVESLRNKFEDMVLSQIDGVHINGGKEQRLPSHSNISFDGCDGENILFLLDLKGTAVSTGSACSSGAVTPSYVLTSMGKSEKQAQCGLPLARITP
jgi:cysteine desulfurase